MFLNIFHYDEKDVYLLGYLLWGGIEKEKNPTSRRNFYVIKEMFREIVIIIIKKQPAVIYSFIFLLFMYRCAIFFSFTYLFRVFKEFIPVISHS